MRLDDINYELPAQLIAQHPIEPRDRARLLVDQQLPRQGQEHRVADADLGARAVCRAVLASRGSDWLTAEEMRRVLAAYGIPLAPTAFARSAAAAVEAAEAMGFPVEMFTVLFAIPRTAGWLAALREAVRRGEGNVPSRKPVDDRGLAERGLS